MKPSLLLIISLFSTITYAQNKINEDVLAAFNNSENVSCIIALQDQMDLLGTTNGLTKEEKARFVYKSLVTHADNSQKGIRSQLDQLGVQYNPFHIFNGVAASLTYEQATLLAGRHDVSLITLDQTIQLSRHEVDIIAPRTEAEWGIKQIQADSVWSLGFEGAGVVIAGQDTGYDFMNPIILDKYRGYAEDTIIHDHNWHDAIFEINPLHGDTTTEESLNPCGFLSSEPCDDHRHGTHTMGTMVGRDSSNYIGVAPQAKWIGCRNMERGYGKPSTYTECFEWFLAPTDLNGENPDPSKAPHVINNSWGCPEMEGCNPENWHIMETAVNNLTAAGTVVVVSAGNDGNDGCGSIYNAASFFDNAFTVGASDDEDIIAPFSSIGPIQIDSSGRMKPDVVAPGVQVRSITLDGFGTWNGTSMAGPHVAGAVALIISANPSLAGEVDIIKNILRETAVPLVDSLVCDSIVADVTPNFVYGSGRIDVLKAVERATALIGTDNPQIEQDIAEVYPNPTDSQVNFVVRNNETLEKIELYDLNGSMVRQANPKNSSFIMDIGGVSSGLYVYKVYTKSGNQAGMIQKF